MSCPPPQAASSADDAARRLLALRGELDRVDDAVHDLMMRRAEIVAQVGALAAKGGVPLRPGREASIVRRLLRRNHGPLAPAVLMQVWRELLAGSTAQQGLLRVAVGGGDELEPLARRHFGALTSLAVTTDAAAALDAVRDGTAQGGAAAAVLPWPGAGERWWVSLLGDDRLHVVGRLPLLGPGPDAAVVTAAAADPSGDDRSLIGGPPGLLGALAEWSVGQVLHADGFVLADVAGFVAAGDGRLPAGAIVVGAYAVGVGEQP